VGRLSASTASFLARLKKVTGSQDDKKERNHSIKIGYPTGAFFITFCGTPAYERWG
jgi:hypothetical protein